MIVAAYIAQFLKEKGIENVFGYVGSMMLKIADEISKLNGIHFIQGFHEQACSFEADAYARVSRKCGVLLVTSGPGAINAMAGIADAYMDSIPLVVLTGQDRITHLLGNPGVRTNGFQDLDIVNIVKPITKYTVLIREPKMLAYELEKAFYIAMNGRKGPVLLDIPMDIQFMEVPNNMDHFVPNLEDRKINLDSVQEVAQKIYEARQPVILVGGGIYSSNSEKELEILAQITKIPIVTTLNGHDAYFDSIGSSGLYGMPSANLAIYNADLLIAMGTRFGQQQVGKNVLRYTKAQIVHVDIDPKELGRVLKEKISICTDIKKFLECLRWKLDIKKIPDLIEWKSKINQWQDMYDKEIYVNKQGIDPVKLVRNIAKISDEDTIFINDVGQNTMWVCQGLQIRGTQRLLTSSGYGSMGFSLPAAIGAKLAEPTRMVISFSGDGGFHMNLQELQFIKIHSLNIKYIVFNNNTLGLMREVQRLYYNNNYVGATKEEFTCVDLEKVANLYHMDYLCLENFYDEKKIKDFLYCENSGIIDCKLSIDTYLRNWNEFLEKYPEILS